MRPQYRIEIKDKVFDEERALYNIINTNVINCKFEGEKDGESVLKEVRNVGVFNCSFSLRYPLWHANTFSLTKSRMTNLTRAPIWYAKNGSIDETVIEGTKCLRESKKIHIHNSDINSEEFGWKCKNISICDSKINSMYFMFYSKNVYLENVNLTGKYSFQYINHLHINNCNLDTKDAFWHSKNVLVTNSIIKGEYLGWFSENLKLVNCHIIGTQPLCYCKNLKLINCTMENTDLSFEYSSVFATIKGDVDSIKNPKSGKIIVDGVKEIIHDHTVMKCHGKIIIRKEKS